MSHSGDTFVFRAEVIALATVCADNMTRRDYQRREEDMALKDLLLSARHCKNCGCLCVCLCCVCLCVCVAGVCFPGVRCFACQDEDITGYMWQCTMCPDYQLCGTCYMNNYHSFHHRFKCIIDNKGRG